MEATTAACWKPEIKSELYGIQLFFLCLGSLSVWYNVISAVTDFLFNDLLLYIPGGLALKIRDSPLPQKHDSSKRAIDEFCLSSI